MKKSKIAEFARQASNEAHEEYMSMAYNFHNMGYTKDLLSEIIDKFDYIERMANRKWYQKLLNRF